MQCFRPLITKQKNLAMDKKVLLEKQMNTKVATAVSILNPKELGLASKIHNKMAAHRANKGKKLMTD